MNNILEKAIYAGGLGFIGAFSTDWQIYWTREDKSVPFDWRKAVARWVRGFLSGALAGLGIGQVSS